jgi:hypothetical protein
VASCIALLPMKDTAHYKAQAREARKSADLIRDHKLRQVCLQLLLNVIGGLRRKSRRFAINMVSTTIGINWSTFEIGTGKHRPRTCRKISSAPMAQLQPVTRR